MSPVAAAPHIAHATVTRCPVVPDATLERVAMALRGARARTGLSEERTVAILAEQGVAFSVAELRRAERTGALGLALASHLAGAYGSTTDCLAGRRAGRTRQTGLDALAA